MRRAAPPTAPRRCAGGRVAGDRRAERYARKGAAALEHFQLGATVKDVPAEGRTAKGRTAKEMTAKEMTAEERAK